HGVNDARGWQRGPGIVQVHTLVAAGGLRAPGVKRLLGRHLHLGVIVIRIRRNDDSNGFPSHPGCAAGAYFSEHRLSTASPGHGLFATAPNAAEDHGRIPVELARRRPEWRAREQEETVQWGPARSRQRKV